MCSVVRRWRRSVAFNGYIGTVIHRHGGDESSAIVSGTLDTECIDANVVHGARIGEPGQEEGGVFSGEGRGWRDVE